MKGYSSRSFQEWRYHEQGFNWCDSHRTIKCVCTQWKHILVTYSSRVLADDIGSAIEKIDKWLGKPVVITSDEVTAAKLPQVLEQAHHTTGFESIVFNMRLNKMQNVSIPSVCSGYQSYAGSPAVLGASSTTFLIKIPSIPWFSGSEQEEDTVIFEQWLHSISDARRNFSDHLIRAAINK